MRVLVPLPVVAPLLGAALCMALYRRPTLQRVVGIGAIAVALADAIALLVHVDREGIAAVQIGGWSAPFGITLVADLTSTLLLSVSLATLLCVLVYAIAQRGTDDGVPAFHPVYLVLAAGVSASFLTGDLFNLFVAFEIMLMASYVLITLNGTGDQVRSGMTYVVISLLSSTLFVTAVGLVYAATGTVNLADLAGRMDAVPAGLRLALGLLLLVVFGIKAAIFPLFFWLPDSYPAAPTPVTAVFAGLLTKVGVYAMVRTQTLLFPNDGPSPLLLGIAGATMIVGVLGAIAQNDIKRILSFHIVSQIGYMVMGLALFSVAGLAGTVFFVAHQIIVKTALFLVGGLIEARAGTGRLKELGGMIRTAPLAAVLFLVAALSLAGIPPFSGFVGKLALVQAGVRAESWGIVAVSLVGSLLTLFSMLKIWAGAFWGSVPESPVPGAPDVVPAGRTPPVAMVGATAGLVVLSVVFAVFAEPLFGLSLRAAEVLVDPRPYVAAVLGS